jgi:hypothetical protein
MAYGRGVVEITGRKSIAGHATITIDYLDVWGFWPTKPGRPFTKTGLLRHTNYADEYPLQQESVEFNIDEASYMQILNLVDEWEHKPPAFFVPANDCVSFINRVCEIMSIKHNPFALLPTSAIREIRRLNVNDARYIKLITDS